MQQRAAGALQLVGDYDVKRFTRKIGMLFDGLSLSTVDHCAPISAEGNIQPGLTIPEGDCCMNRPEGSPDFFGLWGKRAQDRDVLKRSRLVMLERRWR